MRATFTLGEETVEPGERRKIRLPLSRLVDHTRLNMTVLVIHGKREGPTMFVSGAIHGDEIIGVEIIRRLADMKMLKRLSGTLILVPVVNAYGFISGSRYMPDRRDLNRSFPGSAKGSLAAQLANIFMTEIVERSNYGIDLHSGAIHRPNLPQIRADLDTPEVAAMAQAFGASIMINANLRDGSLRQSAQEVGCNMLLYEASEALRFDEVAIRIGVRGVLRVMNQVGMLTSSRMSESKVVPVRCDASRWLRAPIGGVMRARSALGDSVDPGEIVADVSDPFGKNPEPVIASAHGIIIGRTNLPVVNAGDALFHIAQVGSAEDAEETADALKTEIGDDPFFTGPEIV